MLNEIHLAFNQFPSSLKSTKHRFGSLAAWIDCSKHHIQPNELCKQLWGQCHLGPFDISGHFLAIAYAWQRPYLMTTNSTQPIHQSSNCLYRGKLFANIYIYMAIQNKVPTVLASWGWSEWDFVYRICCERNNKLHGCANASSLAMHMQLLMNATFLLYTFDRTDFGPSQLLLWELCQPVCGHFLLGRASCDGPKSLSNINTVVP